MRRMASQHTFYAPWRRIVGPRPLLSHETGHRTACSNVHHQLHSKDRVFCGSRSVLALSNPWDIRHVSGPLLSVRGYARRKSRSFKWKKPRMKQNRHTRHENRAKRQEADKRVNPVTINNLMTAAELSTAMKVEISELLAHFCSHLLIMASDDLLPKLQQLSDAPILPHAVVPLDIIELIMSEYNLQYTIWS